MVAIPPWPDISECSPPPFVMIAWESRPKSPTPKAMTVPSRCISIKTAMEVWQISGRARRISALSPMRARCVSSVRRPKTSIRSTLRLPGAASFPSAARRRVQWLGMGSFSAAMPPVWSNHLPERVLPLPCAPEANSHAFLSHHANRSQVIAKKFIPPPIGRSIAAN